MDSIINLATPIIFLPRYHTVEYPIRLCIYYKFQDEKHKKVSQIVIILQYTRNGPLHIHIREHLLGNKQYIKMRVGYSCFNSKVSIALSVIQLSHDKGKPCNPIEL